MTHVVFSSYFWFLKVVPQSRTQPWAMDSFSHQPNNVNVPTHSTEHPALLPTCGCILVRWDPAGHGEEELLVMSGIDQQ